MSFILRSSTPSDVSALAALGLDTAAPHGFTEADLFVYPSHETWLAERGQEIVAAARLSLSPMSGLALLSDLSGDAGAVLALVTELGEHALGLGADTIQAAVPTGSAISSALTRHGYSAQRRVVHIHWQLPVPPPGEPPQGVDFAEELPDPEEYARLAVTAYRGSWDWLFDHWGGDVAARRNFARLFESPRDERLIAARQKGELIGFVSAGSGEVVPGDFSTFGVLVQPAMRGRGLGGYLLARALRALWSRGVTSAEMHTTAPPESDPPAVRLYLRHGERRSDTTILRRPPAS
jgi:GNAT superfamily N-acetyltransferase